ncbi:hypothetical protein ACFOG5_24075 [Pedobacter fastidiosus]|nr:hypothetical protein [Pedobacter fastidiosus]
MINYKSIATNPNTKFPQYIAGTDASSLDFSTFSLLSETLAYN